MKRKHNEQQARVISHLIACALFISAAYAVPWSTASADDNPLKSGMTAFNAGNYSEAAGHFGLALSTEFNNSVLHYYLGNCYVHMKQRESAIREFRIAYALDPDKDVGKYAKQALVGLNAESGTVTTSSPNAAADALAKAAVMKLFELRSKPGGMTPVSSTGMPSTTSATPSTATTTPPSITSDPTKPPPKPTIEIGRGGKIIQVPPPPTPNPATALDANALRRFYEANRAASATKMTYELQRTAENLQQLLSQQARPGEHHIVPAGTNLYIRNYQTEPHEGTPNPAAHSTVKQVAP